MGSPREEVIHTKQEGWETCSEVQAPLNLILAWKLEEFELGSLEGLVKFSNLRKCLLELLIVIVVI